MQDSTFFRKYLKETKHSRRAIHTDGERQVYTGAKRIHVLPSGGSVLLLLVEAYRVPGAGEDDVGQAGGIRRRAQSRAAVARALRERRVRAAAPAHPGPLPIPHHPALPPHFP